MVTLYVSGLTYNVDGKAILNNISFKFEGGLLTIIGPNGSGKTTLLKAITGLLSDVRGEVLIDGKSPSRYRPNMAYVPAQPSLDPMARPIDIAMAMNYASGGPWRERFSRTLRLLGVNEEDRELSTMSSGEQRLVLIAAALSKLPQALILDEPTAFLDITNQVKVLSLLRDLASSGRLVVMATHDLIYAPMADAVALLSHGSLLAFGRPDDVLSEELLSSAYGIRVLRVGGATSLFVPELAVKRFF